MKCGMCDKSTINDKLPNEVTATDGAVRATIQCCSVECVKNAVSELRKQGFVVPPKCGSSVKFDVSP